MENNKDVDMHEEVKEEEKKPVPQLDADVLIMVKSAQNQNGLRHNDYGRYHHYCTRKLQRMRKSLKFTQGRKQYVQKKVTAEEAKGNHKFIQLQVFKCEANWAYAMQQKQIVSSGSQAKENANRNPNRVKYLAKKRLQKAAQAAQSLL